MIVIKHKNIHNAKSNTGGFTLLELMIAVAVWIILLTGASRLLWYSTNVATGLIAQQEALENARVAIDALSINIKMADGITLNTHSDGTLIQVELRQIRPATHENPGGSRSYAFSYARGSNTLNFSGPGNQIAYHLSAIKLILSDDHELIHITVTTCESLGEPITLTTSVDIRYKNLTIRR